MLKPPPPKLAPQYVLGFALYDSQVLLIRKTRPSWQAGRLNGVGGKVETYDVSIHHAMAREFREETGIDTAVDQWRHIGSHIRPSKFDGDDRGYKLELFATCLSLEAKESVHQTTDEEPVWTNYMKDLGVLAGPTGVSGLAMYIAMAANHLGRPFFTTTIES